MIIIKLINLKTQKMLVIIPLVNISIAIIWFFINLKIKVKYSSKEYILESFYSLFYILISVLIAIPILFVSRVIYLNNPFIGSILMIISFYIWSVIAMWLLIIYQKKHGIE